MFIYKFVYRFKNVNIAQQIIFFINDRQTDK